MYNKRDVLGKILFGAAILILLYMFISPIANAFIHVDEYWTYSLVNLPFMQGMIVAVHDVHPPLYYLIAYLFAFIFGPANLYFLKMASVIPYILIMFVSYFKIKDEYGWLSAGLFVFCLGIMSDFFIEFLTIRMYSWGLFFVLMAFLYYQEVITNWDRKSWIFLTVFTLLSAYTQYFFAITCGLLYLLILIKILKDSELKSNLKQFALSVVALIVCYAPWAVVLIHQISTHPDGSDTITASTIFNYITYFAVKENNFSSEVLIFKIIAFVFLILLLVLIYRKKDKFAGTGVFLMYATIAIGAVVFMFSFIYIRVRYLIPVMGIFWLSASVLLGKIENTKILALMMVLIFILAGASAYMTHEDISDRFEYNAQRDAFLESINNNDSVIVYNTDFGYQAVHDYVNNTKQYSLGDTYFYSDDVRVCKSLDEILEKNPGKEVYLINWDQKDSNKKYEQEYNLTQKYDAKHFTVNLVGR